MQHISAVKHHYGYRKVELADLIEIDVDNMYLMNYNYKCMKNIFFYKLEKSDIIELIETSDMLEGDNNLVSNRFLSYR